MSSSQSSFHAVKKTQKLLALVDRRIVLLNIVVLMSIFSVAVGYVFHISHAATQGYTLRELETQTAELDRNNKQMELAITEARSLEKVAHGVQMLGMVKSGQPQYVVAEEPIFAFGK